MVAGVGRVGWMRHSFLENTDPHSIAAQRRIAERTSGVTAAAQTAHRAARGRARAVLEAEANRVLAGEEGLDRHDKGPLFQGA